MNLEDDLRRALRRTDPPLDFANRVIAGVRQDSAQRESKAGLQAPVVTRFPLKQWFAAAATVALVAAGGIRYYEYQQNVAEAKRIEADIRLAMQITSDALARVQTSLYETSR